MINRYFWKEKEFGKRTGIFECKTCHFEFQTIDGNWWPSWCPMCGKKVESFEHQYHESVKLDDK